MSSSIQFQEALTFDDVLLVPGLAEVMPKDVDLSSFLTPSISLQLPLLSSAMDTVTESGLAIAMAEQGAMGILHMSMSVEDQAQQVAQVKKFESGVVREPLTIGPQDSVADAMRLTAFNRFSGMPVVDGEQVVGIITNRDLRFVDNKSEVVAKLMTPASRLITVQEGASRAEILQLFHQHRIEKLVVVDKKGCLKGLITVKDILKSQENPQASKDAHGRLRVGAAVSTGKDMTDRVAALVEAQVDALVIDTAHGHSRGVLDTLAWIKKNYPELPVIAGNIATGEAALALQKAGADAVKVGMGPGSICTTRIVAGVGVPQITAIYDVAQALAGTPCTVIADGGIRFSGDIAKAIAAGAHLVMIGGLFAGTDESPGDVVLYQGRSYKAYRGMGSTGAMNKRFGSGQRYAQGDKRLEADYVPEGIEGRVPYKGPLSQVLHQLEGGLRSSMGYTGCPTLPELRSKAKFVRITNAGSRESHVHDVTITKEAPNYSVAAE